MTEFLEDIDPRRWKNAPEGTRAYRCGQGVRGKSRSERLADMCNAHFSDRAKSNKDLLLDIPGVGGFADLVALKGKAPIGAGATKLIGKPDKIAIAT